MIIAVGLVYAGIIAIEAPYLVKKRLWKELLTFGFFLGLAMIYSFGPLLNWQPPNLVDGLKMIFNPVTQLIEHLPG